MLTPFVAYVSTAVIFLGIDAIWLGRVATNLYRGWIGGLMLEQPNFAAAAAFYLVYVAGIVYFAIMPAMNGGGWAQAALSGAILGFIAYGTYDMTNLATLKNWPITMTVVDMAWGTLLTSASATAGYLITQRLISGSASRTWRSVYIKGAIVILRRSVCDRVTGAATGSTAGPYANRWRSMLLNDATADLAACAREPIHIPGAIQPHGALFTLHPSELVVLQASRNIDDFLPNAIHIGRQPSGAISNVLNHIRQWYGTEDRTLQVPLTDQNLILVAHRSGSSVIVEVEKDTGHSSSQTLSRLRAFLQLMTRQASVPGSLQATAGFVQELTSFDRVLVYRFDDQWNGQVVAEAGNGALPSYLDLRFPASDIPAQARALYASNPVRIIPNATYEPVPLDRGIDPSTPAVLDLSYAQLRSVSPVHLEYMRNMGTAASMSVSIMIDGRLWGLVACHSAQPHHVDVTIRDACDFVVQSMALRIAAQRREEDAASRVELARVTSRLLTSMTAANHWPEGLANAKDDLLAQVNADGAAIVTEAGYFPVGDCPDEVDVRRIITWLEAEQSELDLFASSHLASMMPAAGAFAGRASGIAAIRISELYPSWLIWFRPEVIRTVRWGGDPHKVVTEEGRIHPRKSFDTWREQVHQQALSWTDAELMAARDLRNAIVGIVLRKAEELAELTSELQRSNKELEAFSYSVSHDLRAPFRHIVGFAQLLREREDSLDQKSRHYLQNISESALSAGRLVDDLLNFSQLGRASIAFKKVDVNKLVEEVTKSVMLHQADRHVEWDVGRLPVAWGDATLLRQVWYNLVENAVKYSRDRAPAKISINGSTEDNSTIYSISDNGVGFDMAYVGKLFGVFQRLQRVEDFDGTGIGLALVRRIVERHNGSIKASGEVDKGATFTFALPTPERKGRALA